MKNKWTILEIPPPFYDYWSQSQYTCGYNTDFTTLPFSGSKEKPITCHIFHKTIKSAEKHCKKLNKIEESVKPNQPLNNCGHET